MAKTKYFKRANVSAKGRQLIQSFRLGEGLLAFSSDEGVKIGRSLLEGLAQKGYKPVFVSSISACGLPGEILVTFSSKDIVAGRNIKTDFYDLAGKLGLPYVSGDVYIEP
ncbi:hypothetical protein HYW76_04700 [Candidatus Pacearchaeota archaeon]|nr:hypothetical protein [Candidatus Pacearchaeota archaeon]